MHKMLLLVDDDPIVNFIHQRLLSSLVSSDKIKVCKDGREALEYLEENASDIYQVLVLLDINMPVMNGWEFLEKVKDKPFRKKLDVMMLTSSVDNEDRNRAQKDELVVDYITKPLDQGKCQQIKCSTRLNGFFNN